MPKKTKENLEGFFNSESINVKAIEKIISKVEPETLLQEHDLVCSILKFLMEKEIYLKQRIDFRSLIKTLIDKKVLQKQDHDLVYKLLVVISNQMQILESRIIMTIANSVIQQNILNQEECVNIISNSIMNVLQFNEIIIANIARQNSTLSHVIAKNVIQQIPPEKLFSVIDTVYNKLQNINNIDNSEKKANVTTFFVTEFLPTLQQRIQTLVANNSVDEERNKNILFQFTLLFYGAILNDLFAQNKSAAVDLFKNLVPYLTKYQLSISTTTSCIDYLKDEAIKHGITLEETV